MTNTNDWDRLSGSVDRRPVKGRAKSEVAIRNRATEYAKAGDTVMRSAPAPAEAKEILTPPRPEDMGRASLQAELATITTRLERVVIYFGGSQHKGEDPERIARLQQTEEYRYAQAEESWITLNYRAADLARELLARRRIMSAPASEILSVEF